MAVSIFQSPFPGRFLQAEGSMTSVLLPQEVAVVPSVSEISDVIATYTGGQILDGDENWGDLGLRGADLLGVGYEVRLGLELAGQVAALASGYGAIVVLGMQLLKWMSAAGPGSTAPDPLLAVLQRINERLNTVEDTTLGGRGVASRRFARATTRNERHGHVDGPGVHGRQPADGHVQRHSDVARR
jgi:hypothetical protein